MLVGGASQVFSRSGLGCWTPLSIRHKVACCHRLGSGIMYEPSNNVGRFGLLLFSLLLWLCSSNTYGELLTADIEA